MGESTGDRILKLRKYLNLTQEAFAEPLRISQRHVSQIEKGKTASEQLIAHICSVYNTTDSWLTTGEGEMFLSAEEIIKDQIARLGEQAFYDACQNLFRDSALVVMEGVQPHRVGVRHPDPDLDHMIRFLTDLWSVGDDGMKAWARIQFARAFPPDVEEEVLKKRAEKQSRESTA